MHGVAMGCHINVSAIFVTAYASLLTEICVHFQYTAALAVVLYGVIRRTIECIKMVN